MTNTSTDQDKNSSDENKVKLLWEILKPYKDKYLQVWWYGGMEKGLEISHRSMSYSEKF
ncbi:hypothetical protein F933_03145 [Acinetobacter beijerinckii CIP 110307]|uniref:Uncharacterized protein n=1 Tax=Acinetobacter beijerinckii CIP 110307 TaxID=1217648 RepID=N9F721_9GAMM|nr:hypothetical protein F933_03145 [Acinetobacter beijerinckii CIP 110307]